MVKLMKLEYICTVEKVERLSPERVQAFLFKAEKGEEIRLELPELIIDKLPKGMLDIGKKVVMVISDETLNPDEWPLLMTGYVYLKKKENSQRKTFISIGGLILRLITLYDIKFDLMQKVEIGVKPL